MKIIHAYTLLNKIGGAQKVLMDVKHYLGGKVYSFNDYHELDHSYKIKKDEYKKLKLYDVFFIKNAVIISHHRKLTTLFVLSNKLFKCRNRIIHVAHNEFYSLKWLTFLPNEIIAVSKAVKKNLCQFFNISPERVEVILNGLSDKNVFKEERVLPKEIRIIYPARISPVKQQMEVAQFFSSLNLKNISIFFAGTGPEEHELSNFCQRHKNIHFLGQLTQIENSLIEYDFLLLFSKNEGLPLSLIEALRAGLPAICNNVGGNSEVIDSSTGFVVSNWNELGVLLKQLDKGTDKNYALKIRNCRSKFLSLFSKQVMQRKYYTKLTSKQL